jgi:MFS family permease
MAQLRESARTPLGSCPEICPAVGPAGLHCVNRADARSRDSAATGFYLAPGGARPTAGLSQQAANVGTSLLWLGLAAGCFVAPWISDRLRRRKLPVVAGIVLQLAALAALVYGEEVPPAGLMSCCVLFGFGNAAHMLAFSTAGDVVEPKYIGTSAAIVNGLMFVVGGILISRPGLRAGLGLEAGISPGTMELAQYASRPLMLSVVCALVVAALMRETHPAR